MLFRSMPTSEVETIDGVGVLDLLTQIKLIPSKGEGRRLIQQNGLSINDNKVTDVNMVLDNSLIGDKGMIIKKGKKVFHRVILK